MAEPALPMAQEPRYRPFTDAWAAAFRAAIDADPSFRAAAARWSAELALVLTPAPEFGFAEAVGIELTLADGRCHAAAIRPADALRAPLVLTADYATWKAVARGEVDAMFAVTSRRIAVRGNVMALMLHARAATALLACAQRVGTEFPDER